MNSLKVIIIFSLFIKYFIKAAPPQCLTEIGSYNGVADMPPNVDWWVLIQLFHSSAIYTDSNLKKNGSIINELQNYNTKERQNSTLSSPLYKTYQQSKIFGYNSIVYNDQNGESSSGDCAHGKGFFIWNDEGGIHVIHSYPKTPANIKTSPDEFIQKTKPHRSVSQHSFCKKLSVDELSIIPKYVIYANVKIQSINNQTLSNPCAMTSFVCDKRISQLFCDKIDAQSLVEIRKLTTFDEMDKEIEKYVSNVSNGWPTKMYTEKMKQIASVVRKNGLTSNSTVTKQHYNMIKSFNNNEFKYFIQTNDKSFLIKGNNQDKILKNANYIILWSYIANNYSDVEWMSQTWSMSGKDRLKPLSNDQIKCVANYEYPFGTDGSKRSSDYSDHSKLFYGSSPNGNKKIFCFGDSNWATQQQKRGGGALCTDQLGYLVNYMVRRVSFIADNKSYNETDLTFKKYLPASSAGTDISFYGIEQAIANQNVIINSKYCAFAIELVKEDPIYPLGFIFFKPEKNMLKKIPFFLSNLPIKSTFTEPFSVYIFANIEKVVLFCINFELCTDYKDTYKFKFIENVKANGEYSLRTSTVVNGKTQTTPNLISKLTLYNPNYEKIPTHFKNMISVGKFTEIMAKRLGIDQLIRLSQFNPNPKQSFKFPIDEIQIKAICYKNTTQVENKYLISFSTECYDNLVICLNWAKGNQIIKESKVVKEVLEGETLRGDQFTKDHLCSITKETLEDQKRPLKKKSRIIYFNYY